MLRPGVATLPILDMVIPFMLLGLVAAIAFGAMAMSRRRAIWMVSSSIALTIGSIPLLLGGIGVLGIALAVVLLALARSMPGYADVRWIARSFALAGLGMEIYLQYAGKQRGNAPSTVDWILLFLAVAMCAVAWAPMRSRRGY